MKKTTVLTVLLVAALMLIVFLVIERNKNLKQIGEISPEKLIEIYNKETGFGDKTKRTKPRFAGNTYVGGRQLIEQASIDSAKDWIERYQDENNNKVWFPLRTEEDKNLSGYFIKRKVFDSILSHPECTGIRLYFAKIDPEAPKRKGYTHVVCGTREGNSTGEQVDEPNFTVWENIDPCPGNCNKNKPLEK